MGYYFRRRSMFVQFQINLVDWINYIDFNFVYQVLTLFRNFFHGPMKSGPSWIYSLREKRSKLGRYFRRRPMFGNGGILADGSVTFRRWLVSRPITRLGRELAGAAAIIPPFFFFLLRANSRKSVRANQSALSFLQN